MRYNKCETCGADGGRAGSLIKEGEGPNECANCRDTRKTRAICIHTSLKRTDAEIEATMRVLADLD